MDNKQLKSEMDMHKTVKDSGDTRKIERSETSVISKVNKVVSDRGDSKTDRKAIETTKPEHQKCDEFRIKKEVEKALKSDMKANENRAEKVNFIDRNKESVTVSTRKFISQNTKDGDVAKKSDGKEPFNCFLVNKERRRIATIINKDVKIPTAQGLVNNITRIKTPQILTAKNITKGHDAKEIAKNLPASNESSQDITINVCDRDMKMTNKQKIVINDSTNKYDSYSITRRDRYTTKKSAERESARNNERDQNITLNGKDKKITNKQEFINNVSVRKYDSQNMARKDRDVTKTFNGHETNKSVPENNKCAANFAVNINDRSMKMPIKEEINNISTRKYDPQIMNMKRNIQKGLDGKEIIKSFPVNKECGQNITVNEREENIPNNSTSNKNLEREEKKIVRDRNLNMIKLNVSNIKTGDTPRENVRSQNAEAKIKNDRFSKKSPQQNKENREHVAANENKISNHTGIFTSDKMEKITLPVVSPHPLKKRPVIKTITARNDKVKVYKSMTFVDQKKQRTPLKINLADAFKQPKTSSDRKIIITSSRDSVKGEVVKEKTTKKKEILKRGRHKRRSSPKHSPGPHSPYTEVAKWAPNSINNHTKLYYEAWVDTTLAAISKNSRNEKLFLGKQNIFQKALEKALAERPRTPELVSENLTDERFMGRIKIRQR